MRLRPGPLMVTLSALALPACTLIDQTTFNPHAADAPVIPQPPPAAPTAVAAGPSPLVVIAPGSTDYAETLRGAVAAARARKPGVVFDVVEIQPPDAPADAGLGAAAAGAARTIVAAGVQAAQVRLAVRPEAGGRAGEVRVYVR